MKNDNMGFKEAIKQVWINTYTAAFIALRMDGKTSWGAADLASEMADEAITCGAAQLDDMFGDGASPKKGKKKQAKKPKKKPKKGEQL